MGPEFKRPPVGEALFEAGAFFTGIVLLCDGLYGLAMSFAAPGELLIKSMSVGKVLAGISVLVVDYREVKK